VVVIEKTDRFGGSTARSGGGLWLPGNEVLRKAGVRDTPEQARAYLAYVAGDGDRARQRALLEHGPAMLAFVRASTPVDFAWVPGYADYYPEAPGGLAQGRSIGPVPLDGRVLGPELAHSTRPMPQRRTASRSPSPTTAVSLGPRHPRAMLATAKALGRMARTRLLRQPMLSLGQALAAGLRAGLMAREVPVWLGTPMTGLQLTDGRVTGVEVTRDGGPALIRANRGVVLAAGGFERNEQMRRRYQRPPIGTEWTTGSAGNTGDAITAGRGGRGGARPDGRRLVGPVHTAVRRALFLPG
jgi:3-oxosteroid 1-dehydrogenase